MLAVDINHFLVLLVRGGRRSGRAKQGLLKAVIRSSPDKDVVEEAQKALDKL